MSCLTHNKRFRSLFHNVINELRSENRTPTSILHGMPRLCCTCNEEVQETVTLNEYNAFAKLENLIVKVIREKEPNAKLILSMNRLGSLINEHRMSVPTASVEEQDSTSASSESDAVAKRQISYDSSSSRDSSSSDAEDYVSMDVGKSRSSLVKRSGQKPAQLTGKRKKPAAPKSMKSGTFVFLPYTFNGNHAKRQSESLLEVAKSLQRQRFISANGHIPQLEKQYHVQINMITRKTSQEVTNALESAKKALGNLKIHDSKGALKTAAKESGEWVLLRSKKPQDDTKPEDIDQTIEALTSRWTSSLTIDKRQLDHNHSAGRSKRSRK